MSYIVCCLFVHIRSLITEGKNLILKQNIKLIVFFSIDLLLLTMFVLRAILVFKQLSLVDEFVAGQMEEYIPVFEFSSENNFQVEIVEAFTFCVLIISHLCMFYFEFFGLIFLTFKLLLKKLFVFVVFYVILTLSVSFLCNRLFGPYVSKFSSLSSSVQTVLVLINLDKSDLSEMLEHFPTTGNIIMVIYISSVKD